MFVAIQAALLVTLVVLPGRDDWSTPDAVGWAGLAVSVVGFVVLGVAAVGLGQALTPTPVPKSGAELVVTGLYRLVRHPIYTGVILIVVGLVVRSGSLVSLAVGVATIAFFNAKAAWEERRLADHYDGYREYAARTPRFIPWAGRGRARR